MKEISHLKAIKKKKKKKNLNAKRHLLQTNQNISTILLHSHENLFYMEVNRLNNEMM